MSDDDRLTVDFISSVPWDRPVLIAGPTASGKSALAMAIARAQDRQIVNADALQVWSCWRVLSARPSPAEEAEVSHRLFGHLDPGAEYSVGHWLREVETILKGDTRPVIVGGTGLYLSALTEGLADIPPIGKAIRLESEALLARGGIAGLLAGIDPATAGQIDRLNPLRVQRAWEVLRATGRGLADWHAAGSQAVLPPERATLLRLDCDRDWLAMRIDQRFASMVRTGAIEEVRAVLAVWDPQAPWARAIGAPELANHLKGLMTLPDAISAAQAASRQYAKRQRTWLRRKMGGWHGLPRP